MIKKGMKGYDDAKKLGRGASSTFIIMGSLLGASHEKLFT